MKKKNRTSRTKKFRSNTRGAVLVEFAVAIMPMLTAFFCFMQVGKMYAANLVLKHATVGAARAAAVIENPNKMNSMATNKRSEVELAALAGLGKYYTEGAFTNVSVKVTNPGGDPHGLVTVDVTATYQCQVPLGGIITCLLGGGTKTKTESVSLPLQGAKYAEEQ